jgi:twitching motility protein PilT
VKLSINQILYRGVEQEASDVHITVGLPPMMRVEGTWIPYDCACVLPQDSERLVLEVLGRERMKEFAQKKEYDLSYSIEGGGRFRVNVFWQRGSMGMAIRILPYDMPNFEQLGLPVEVMQDLCNLPNGIVLICGQTGSGKSTTLAAMLSYINQTKNRHIVTIEDPIEFLHNHDHSIIDQREVYSDTSSFASAMKHVLRQSPDVVMIGEVRDQDTVRTAVALAESGHLVLTSTHAGEAVHGLIRLVDMFPASQQQEIRVSLSLVLRGMVIQQLLNSEKQHRRVLACEVLLSTPAVSNLIREGKFQLIQSHLQTKQGLGMCSMNNTLAQLLQSEEISLELAMSRSRNPAELQALMEYN